MMIHLAISLGVFTSISATIFLYPLICNNLLSVETASLFSASLGASAIVLLAMPVSQATKPLVFLAGQFISSFVGVVFYKIGLFLLLDLAWTAAVAVVFAYLLMRILSCLHPPSGSTALIAVIGNEEVHQLGFEYIFFPVMLNSIIFVIFILPFYYYVRK